MPQLVLINGAPGAGKSTIAHRLAQKAPLDLALDVDVIKHSLGRWDADPEAAGIRARRLAVAMAGAQLDEGGDVFVGQFAARLEFAEQLQAVVERRPSAIVIDASGELDSTIADISARLAHPTGAPRDRRDRP